MAILNKCSRCKITFLIKQLFVIKISTTEFKNENINEAPQIGV